MKVKDLIDLLENCNPDAWVTISIGHADDDLEIVKVEDKGIMKPIYDVKDDDLKKTKAVFLKENKL